VRRIGDRKRDECRAGAVSNLTKFRYLDRVVRLGSVRRAADSLHVAASAISRQITALEKELESDLFEKVGRGLRLTPAGEVVAARARAILSAYDQLKLDVDDLHGLRKGHVRLWAVEGTLQNLVGNTFAAFHREFPNITLDIVFASTDRILQAIIDDDADIGIPFNPALTPGIRTCYKLTDSLSIAVAPNHPLARRKRIKLADLSAFSIAVPDKTFGIRHLIDAEYQEAGLVLRPAVITNSIEMLRSLARSGVACSFLTPMSIRREKAAESLALVPIESVKLRNAHVDICVREGRVLPAAASKLLDFLIRTAERLKKP
jgi:DNA-binding transcriptional LysR family regulator